MSDLYVRKTDVLFAATYFLVRVVDGKTEAGGFETAAEAQAWADDQGHRVVPREAR